MSILTFDYTQTLYTPEYLSRFASTAADADSALKDAGYEYTGWLDYPLTIPQETLLDIMNTAEEIKRKCDSLVVIGIGGSYLGAKAGISMFSDAFNPKEGCPEVYFAGWNMSAVYHAQIMKKLKNREVCLIVVSKSGTTLETTAAFKLFRYFLFEKYGNDYVKRIYAVTDEKSGELRREADKAGYKTMVLPGDIGGRYSLFTPAGLLPLACGGADVLSVIKGARRAYEDISTLPFERNAAHQYAVLRRLMEIKGKSVEVYGYWDFQLEYFTEWLKQLFGESEGKQGKGLLPASAMFPRDLHSLGQFLQQGNPIVFETMLSVENPTLDIAYEGGKSSYDKTAKIIEKAVSAAHSSENTPVMNFVLRDLSEETFGYTSYFFMRACAVSCVLLGVNPFDQPGVEAYKAKVKELLGK
ncbi:MAG: glucose-6-phosphate isomerase [Eubacteriaceae bacterium]|nr:glucose-6-phosphate isomerase [Eubacteriaceae bacterium]